MWGKTLTLDQIQKRGWSLVNRCYLCQMDEESINHILLHCVKTKGFMGDVLCFFWVVLGTSPLVRGTLLG